MPTYNDPPACPMWPTEPSDPSSAPDEVEPSESSHVDPLCTGDAKRLFKKVDLGLSPMRQQWTIGADPDDELDVDGFLNNIPSPQDLGVDSGGTVIREEGPVREAGSVGGHDSDSDGTRPVPVPEGGVND